MTTTEAPPELELACHCAADVEGHAPGEDGCTEAPVKPRSIRPFKAGPRQPSDTARGTCPGCGKRQVVRRISVRGYGEGFVRGIEIACELRITEHKIPGGVCPGGIPTETRFREGAEVARWVAVHGQDSIERKAGR